MKLFPVDRRFGISRLGLSSRLVMIVLASVILALGLGGAMSLLSRENRIAEPLSLPRQIGAIVALAETSDAAARNALAQATSHPGLSVAFPAAAPIPSPVAERLPAVEWLIGQHLSAPDRHEVQVLIEGSPKSRPLAWLTQRLSPMADAPLIVAVSLPGGGWAEFRMRGSPAGRILGVPAGFWLGCLGALLALIAVRAVMREARPLAELETSLLGFSRDAVPRAVPAGGAADLARVIAATNEMQRRVASLIEARGVLLASISHDLRTYLTRLRLRVEELPDEAQRESAIRDLDDMTSLLQDSLAIARGQPAPERSEPVDLEALIAAEAGTADDSRVRFVTHCAAASCCVEGDAVALRRLLVNLIDNARRHGNQVEVSLGQDGAYVRLRVDDDGPGIPVANRELVFEPFYRTDPSRSTTTGGAGLGLTIARQIAEAHGGRIRALDGPLGGSRLEVHLPRMRCEAGSTSLHLERTRRE